MATSSSGFEAKRAAMAYFSGPVGVSFGFSHSPASGRAQGSLPIGDVIGVGIGARESLGSGVAGEEVVRVYVKAKAAVQGPIPTSFGPLQSDVIEVGDVTVTALLNTGQRMGRHRPMSCGISVGHPNITAGTLGCRVKKSKSDIFILSNNHVLADSNLASINDPIIQPGTSDGGSAPADTFARLSQFHPIDFSAAGANDFDAAIASLAKPGQVESDIIDIGPPGKNPQTAQLYQSVRKHGRTTGHTVGVIVDTSLSLWVGYGTQKAWFQDQIAIQGVGPAHFSIGGDSGSLVVDAVSLEPVALLFAGTSSGLTVASPIGPILSHFGVTID